MCGVTVLHRGVSRVGKHTGLKSEIPNGGCFTLLAVQGVNDGRSELLFTSGVYGRR